jgi:hypothetical protein
MQERPVMTTIGNRPAKVAHLHAIDGTYVQCKLPNGDEAYVPLGDVFQLFEKELVGKARNRGATRNTEEL